MAIQIQLRNDTAANWTAANPILAIGELGLESNTGSYKIGNGVDTWSALPYGGVDGASAYDIAVANGFTGTEQEWLDSLVGAPGVGVPAGGTEGQVLAKATNGDYETTWVDQSGGGGSGDSVVMTVINFEPDAISPLRLVEWTQFGNGQLLGARAMTQNAYGIRSEKVLGISTEQISGGGGVGNVLVRGYVNIDPNIYGNTNSYLYLDPSNSNLVTSPADGILWKAPIGYISSSTDSGNAVLYYFGTELNLHLENVNSIQLSNPQPGDSLVFTEFNYWRNQPVSGGGGEAGINENLLLNSDFNIDQEFNFADHNTGWLTDMWNAENMGPGDLRAVRPVDIAEKDSIDAQVTHKAVFVCSAGGMRIQQSFEDIRKIANTQVTLSFWYKISDNNSGNISPDFVQIFDATDGNSFVTTNFPGVNTDNAAGVWTKYQGTAFIPGLAGNTLGTNPHAKLRINVNMSASELVSIAGVKLEYGSEATAYQPAFADKANELAACQRFFWYWNSREAPYSFLELAFGLNSDLVDCGMYYPTKMRVPPTVSFSGSDWEQYGGATSGALGNLVPTAFQPSTESVTYRWNTSSNAVTGGAGKIASINTLDAWIKHDARII